jgi:hypothetical protein
MITKVVPMRADGDCGIASLAMLLNMTYEDVYAAASQVDAKYRGKNGLTIKEVRAIADKLGVPLKYRRKFKLSEMDGIVGLERTDADEGHWATVKEGIVFETNGEVYSLEDYFTVNGNWKATCLLTED